MAEYTVPSLFERMDMQARAAFLGAFFTGCHEGRWRIEFEK